MDLREYVAAHDDSRELLDEVRGVVLAVGDVAEKWSRSQVAFRRGRTFALAWAPGQYLGERGAPLVLSIVLPERSSDPRWKEVVEPHPGTFMHHLELHAIGDIDDQVRGWISEAYAATE